MGVNFELIEPTFSGQLSPDCELSILYGMDSFAWLVRDAQGHVLALKEYHLDRLEELATIVENEESLRANYRRVHRGLIYPKHTFIPRRLFRESEKEKYLQHLTPVMPGDELLTNSLEAFDNLNVFLYPEDLVRMAPLPGEGLQHLSTILLRGIQKLGLPSDEPYLHVHFLHRHLWLGALENAQLKYCNLFPVRSAEDAVYYILLLFDHMGVSPSRQSVRLSGRIDPRGQFYQTIAPYLARPDFLDFEPSIHLGDALRRHPTYWFFDLFNLSA